jgi:hypothetical protein
MAHVPNIPLAVCKPFAVAPESSTKPNACFGAKNAQNGLLCVQNGVNAFAGLTAHNPPPSVSFPSKAASKSQINKFAQNGKMSVWPPNQYVANHYPLAVVVHTAHNALRGCANV